MSDNVGQIDLDLVINQRGFQRQVGNIENMARRAGKLIASAFALKKLIDFGKQCLELGSDLSEVQNVVDVTFPNMIKQVDDFAKSAAATFGLSETMAKKYMGTFGAMSKAFGFSEKAAYDMSTALTGLSGDVASFYNISQDEAYTKLKSVFTGETETLKDLGVVMTQNALDQYALANGYGKVTAKMTEQEKVALRFAFVQEKLSLASGDFARTSDGWANQTRLLKLQFDSLKASIGQGLISAFTPVIKVINTLMGKLVSLANCFKDFMANIFGKQSDGMAETSGDIADATSNMEDLGDATKDTTKKMNGLLSIDEINTLGDTSDSSSGTGDIGDADLSNMEKQTDNVDKALDKLIGKVTELKNIFSEGFNIGLNGANFDNIIGSCESIKKSLKDIFNDSGVQDAANNYINTLVKSMGKSLGSFVSIGITMGENVLGGLSIYLEGAKDRIKSWIIKMFDISSETAEIKSNFSVAVSDIFSVFKGETAKNMTSDVIEIFSSTFMGATEIFAKFGRDAIDALTAPFINNKDTIKEALENTLNPIQQITGTIADAITETWDKINNLYDEHIKPYFEAIKEGFSDIVRTILDAYNNYIVPILDEWGDRFTKLYEEHIAPMVDQIVKVFGKVIDVLKDVWQNYLVPLNKWIIENVVPILAPIFKEIGDLVFNCFGTISDGIKDMMQVIGGIIDFIAGVFTGDWKRAWQGVKDIFGGMWNSLKDVVKGAWDRILDLFKNGGQVFSGVVGAIGDVFKRIVNCILGGINKVISTPFNTINGLLNRIRNVSVMGIEPFSGFWGENPLPVPQIPYLARGGIVDSPTLAMVGEAGKEAVVPLENNTQGLELLANKLISMMGNNNNNNSMNSSNDNPINIYIQVKDTTLGKVTIDSINKLNRLAGKNLIKTI